MYKHKNTGKENCKNVEDSDNIDVEGIILGRMKPVLEKSKQEIDGKIQSQRQKL